MPRPRHCRQVQAAPKVNYYKPRGIPLSELTETYLSVEGLEAIRLADLLNLNMDKAAVEMGISRHTFGRVLGEARRAVADALVNGRALRIEGGQFRMKTGEEADIPAPRKELFMNIIAVSAEGPTLDDLIDPRFGRAGGFVIVDTDNMRTTYLDNGSSQAQAHGAGIAAAENIVNAGAGVLLTGYVGPKAFEALNAAGVKIGQDLDGLTVRQALERYQAGDVPFATGPNK